MKGKKGGHECSNVAERGMCNPRNDFSALRNLGEEGGGRMIGGVDGGGDTEGVERRTGGLGERMGMRWLEALLGLLSR